MIEHKVSRPIIQNMVDTRVGNGLRIETCYITIPGGVPTVDSGRGTCSPWISILTDEAPGRTIINFAAGTFVAAPICTITWEGGGQGFYATDTSTSSSIRIRMMNAAQAEGDLPFGVTCIGAR